MTKYFLFLFFTVTVLASCQKNVDDNNGNNNGLSAQTYLDVAYGNDASQKMDVYLPANRSTATTKVIIMIHGGAWYSGDKLDFKEFVDTIKRRQPDYAIFNINYRLANGVTNSFPAQENDVKSAVEFIFGKKDEYNISEKFILLGASSGAHNALLQAYKYSTPVKIKAVADFFGPANLVDLYNFYDASTQPLLATIVGGTPTSNPAIYQSSSPINFINAQSPPTIIFHGGLDPVVPPAQSAALAAKLQLNGVINQYYLYPTETHATFTPVNLTDALNKLQAFLNANVN
jgi:acetyl esterase/lipase